jgi:hypothetical protein
MITVDDTIHIEVRSEYKDLYHPSFLHDIVGRVWEVDETHVWITSIQRDITTNKPYISGPHRYRINDVIITELR